MKKISQRNSYIFLLVQDKVNCAFSEFTSVANAYGIDLTLKSNTLQEFTKRYVVLEDLEEKSVKSILSRTIQTKSAFEVWGVGRNYDELKSSLLQYPMEKKEKFYDEQVSFSCRVKGLGRKISPAMQKEKIEILDTTLPFRGPINLNNPDEEYYIFEDYISTDGKLLDKPSFVYFTRFICEGQRKLLAKFSLKTRKFIGNTSMDPELSFLMANLAGVKPGSFIFDPFVGSGSLLIGAAHFGGYVLGADINYNILHARGKSSRKDAGYRQRDETIENNLAQYNLQGSFVDKCLCDAAIHPWNTSNELFDAIITDPPYGIREGSVKVGAKGVISVKTEDLTPGMVHFPERMGYHLDNVFKDLLLYASKTLIIGGKLVYWLPVNRQEYTSDMVPLHPSLKLLCNAEQILNSHSSRRLIVMEKFQPYIESQAAIDSNFFKGHNSFRNKYFKVEDDSS